MLDIPRTTELAEPSPAQARSDARPAARPASRPGTRPAEAPTVRRRRRRPWRALFGLLVVAGAIAGAVAWRTGYFEAPPPPLVTAPVTVGDVEETVLATGILKPVKLVAVGAQVSGRITALQVGLGQEVKTGDLIAEIDSVTQQNALKTAEASLANVRAQKVEKEAALVLTEQTLARQKTMLSQRAGVKADLEAAEADVSTTRAQIAALEAQIVEAEVAVETARANLGYTRITAPIDGTVLAIVSQEGQTVNAAQTAPTIVVLGRLDTMTVRAEISEADVVRVQPGQPVYFTILGDPEHRYEATLQSIEPAPESITSDRALTSTASSSSSSSSASSSSAIYYNGIFEVPNPDRRLRTYMTAEVHIVLARAAGVLTVPSVALGRRNRDGTATVQVAGPDGQAVERRVEVGLNNKITAEIRSGLSEGEKVVTGSAQAGASADAPRGRGPRLRL